MEKARHVPLDEGDAVPSPDVLLHQHSAPEARVVAALLGTGDEVLLQRTQLRLGEPSRAPRSLFIMRRLKTAPLESVQPPMDRSPRFVKALRDVINTLASLSMNRGQQPQLSCWVSLAFVRFFEFVN